MRVMHEVTGCDVCPLEDYDGQECQHPLAPRDYDNAIHTTRNAPPPARCPLRAGELLLQLRAKP